MKQQTKKPTKSTGIICVHCGSPNACTGSMRHPYCKKCFKEVWDNDQDRYFAWLEKKVDDKSFHEWCDKMEAEDNEQ